MSPNYPSPSSPHQPIMHTSNPLSSTRILLTIIVLIISLSCLSHGTTDAFPFFSSSSHHDSAPQAQYIEKIKSLLKETDASSHMDWTQKHDAFLTLLKFKEPLDAYKSSQCENIQKLAENQQERNQLLKQVSQNHNLDSVYHSVAVEVALKCKKSKQFDSLIQEALKTFATQAAKHPKDISMQQYYYFARILILKADLAKEFMKSSNNLATLKKLFHRLSKTHAKNLSEASYQIETITALAKKLGGPKIDWVFDVLFQTSKYVAQVANQVNPHTSLTEASLFARAANKLASISKITSKFPKKVNEVLAKILMQDNLLEDADSSDAPKFLRSAFHQVDALRALQASPIHIPVLIRNIDLDLDHNRLIVEARDISGHIPKTLKLKRAYSAGNSKSYILEAEQLKQKDGKLVLDFSHDRNAVESFGTKVGEFVFEFTSEKDDYVVARSIKFSTNVEVKGFEMTVYERAQYSQVASRQPVQYPNEMPHITVDTSHQFIEVQISVGMKGEDKPVSPQQVFLHFYPHFDSTFARGKTFMMKQQSLGTYTLKVDFTKEEFDFRSVDGDYAMEIIIGDSFITQPIQWNVGQMRLTFDQQYQPSREEERWTLRHQIVHMFQPAEKRSHGIVSIIFCALVLVPLVGFILYVLRLTAGHAFTQLPSDPTYFSANIALQACIVAMIGVLAMYFISWRIFRVLKCLIVLAVVAGFVGAHALRGVAMKRNQKKL